MKKGIKKILSYSPLTIYETIRDKKKRVRRDSNQQKQIENYLINGSIKKLQLGCGANYLKDWLNTDLSCSNEVTFLDAGKKFPIPENSFHYIFSEHLFEHLSVSAQLNMMEESYKILKKGGVMRIATPSLDFLFNLYKHPTSLENKQYIQWAIKTIPKLGIVNDCIKDKNSYYCFVINNFFRDWGHQMIHNYSSLKGLALQIGFSEVRQCKVNQSEVIHLRNIERHGMIIPQEMNLLETMVVEFIK